MVKPNQNQNGSCMRSVFAEIECDCGQKFNGMGEHYEHLYVKGCPSMQEAGN